MCLASFHENPRAGMGDSAVGRSKQINPYLDSRFSTNQALHLVLLKSQASSLPTRFQREMELTGEVQQDLNGHMDRALGRTRLKDKLNERDVVEDLAERQTWNTKLFVCVCAEVHKQITHCNMTPEDQRVPRPLPPSATFMLAQQGHERSGHRYTEIG